ncbi:MAG: phosphotyrosine protein phosphatase [Cellvibrionales bacterium]|nr:MAG: phosphotyrosine protein phosphatase [Cellvibrionales bacterium]
MFNRFFSPKNNAYQVSVLMVCTENYCRSPMAEGMLRRELIERGLSQHITVDSAGTHVSKNRQHPDVRAQNAVLPKGAKINGLRSRSIRRADFSEFDYILAMDNSNYRSLLAICSNEYQHKLALIMSFAPELGVTEVPDPYYSNKAGFKQVYTFLEQAILGLVDSIDKEYGLS